MDIEVYVLTHKKIEEPFSFPPYTPLLNGSILSDDDFGYVRDDTGENISKLNIYYAELTGQYWAWKNSKVDIIGFCQYRRWFVKNFKYDKLNDEDIKKDLEDHDIILPVKTIFNQPLEMGIKEGLIKNPNYGAKWEDYVKLENIIKENFSEYYPAYKQVMYGNVGAYNCNMFICKKELADKYLSWLFKVLDELKNEIDFSAYPENNKRVLGFFSEYLLTVFVYTHNLRIKEHYIINTDRKFPIVTMFNSKFPFLRFIEDKILNFKLKHK